MSVQSDRIKSFIDRPDQVDGTLRDIMGDDAISVTVYRADDQDSSAKVGFENDTSETIKKWTILARIDKRDNYRSKSTQNNQMLGTTDSNDIRINDRWHWTDPSGKSYKLLVKRIDIRARVYQVDLDYE